MARGHATSADAHLIVFRVYLDRLLLLLFFPTLICLVRLLCLLIV